MTRIREGVGKCESSESHRSIEQIPYLAAGSGDKGVIPSWLPIFFGEMAHMPNGCDAVIVTSDLQGVTEAESKEQALLGEVLPAFVTLLLQIEKPSVRPERTLVLLCGDLYADPLKRGSSGDPLAVWTAFQREFGHVVGVAGNHDLRAYKKWLSNVSRCQPLFSIGTVKESQNNYDTHSLFRFWVLLRGSSSNAQLLVFHQKCGEVLNRGRKRFFQPFFVKRRDHNHEYVLLSYRKQSVNSA
ncbi:metallophosphoesterase [Brevibacillus agri]|uniref:metallophosphoesterase n=1 Tax=Brevibacillus agri TaxID=51101 RepID=UPI0024BFDD63|nr:metallophosphoesterase [Brevibacillus agri]MED4568958.1 metallophosphoesterase [Brevibacillus agri]WHX30649.1 metallophosphoesterase [Brevibacillus agri]